MHKGQLSYLPPIIKLIFLFAIVLLFGILSALFMSLVAEPVFGVDMRSLNDMTSNIGFMQAYQILQSISLFVLPSLLAFYLFYNSFSQSISGKNSLSAQSTIITVFLIFAAQAFIAYSGWLNHQLRLPESLKELVVWMTEKEQELAELTTLLIRSDNWWQILITVFMMSILPALGEEFLFRGLLQRELSTWFNNKHIAIILTAILFSAVHMQFLTFLPRFLLGIMLGYLYVWSGSLWLAVIGHFTNNFMAIVAYMYLSSNGSDSPLNIPTENPFGLMTILSFMAITGCLYAIKKTSNSVVVE
ncbi:CPBP family intramembrane metalloprotease [Carboxylicivirga sp. A043]|uniref:CPBP family intramembrane glutamic endopeptidase n=1 Tax=Carboxylicivirga litoralis TaxID=2816963 RepID=UPI0021CB2317|nr:CPBP family intramembrane glutamic endopeptidase [Carboxylicivirga sp. A043]MCU4156572.1 CPBP family intramembrane metalloprotease [Carboxylicivirga sp. A043]